MGTINFKTSDFITLAIKPYQADEIAKDADFLQYAREEYPETDPETVAEWNIETYYEADQENFNSIAAKYDFYYFHIRLRPGYYESFYIDIESNYPVFFDDYTEKREALKEVTEIKQFLTECAGVGFTACSPGWITSYKDHAATLEAIKAAAEEMRDSIRATPTWRQYNRETA